MSLSSYTVTLARDDPPFIAIPVFPSRMFRHGSIFVSAKSGIREPGELAGKRVGVPEYQMTAPVWIRGILADDYGVTAESVEHFTGGEEQPGREEKLKLNLPAQFRVRPLGPTQTLSRISPTARSTRSSPRARRPPSRRAPVTSGGCSRTTSKPSASTTGARGSSPSCTRSSSAATCTARIPGSRSHSSRRSSRPSGGPTTTCSRRMP